MSGYKFFLAVLTVSFSKRMEGINKLMLCQMHNYSKGAYTHIYVHIWVDASQSVGFNTASLKHFNGT